MKLHNALITPAGENKDFQGHVEKELFFTKPISPTAQLKDLCDLRPKSLPRFSGSTSEVLVDDWFDVAEQYAHCFGLTDTKKLNEFAKKLTGEAKDYHLSKLARIDNYHEWKASLIEQFFQGDQQQYLTQWENGLYQKEDQSVTKFAIQVRSVYAKAFGLKILMSKQLYNYRTNEKIKAFVKGLACAELKKRIFLYLARLGNREPSWKRVVEKSQYFQYLIELQNVRLRSKRSAGDDSGYTKAYIASSATPHDHKASYGVFFPLDEPKNIGQLMNSAKEKPTCNTAILYGTTQAIHLAKKAGIRRLEICTNSYYLHDSMIYWAFVWLKNDWLKYDGTPVENIRYWRNLLDALIGMEIKLVKIKSEADELAMKEAKKLAVSARTLSAII